MARTMLSCDARILERKGRLYCKEFRFEEETIEKTLVLKKKINNEKPHYNLILYAQVVFAYRNWD